MPSLPYPVERLDDILEFNNGESKKFCHGPSSMLSVGLYGH
jgi:hypothetical protein